MTNDKSLSGFWVQTFSLICQYEPINIKNTFSIAWLLKVKGLIHIFKKMINHRYYLKVENANKTATSECCDTHKSFSVWYSKWTALIVCLLASRQSLRVRTALNTHFPHILSLVTALELELRLRDELQETNFMSGDWRMITVLELK